MAWLGGGSLRGFGGHHPCPHRCQVTLGGQTATVQTYSWTNSFYGDNERFVASAYPVSP